MMLAKQDSNLIYAIAIIIREGKDDRMYWIVGGLVGLVVWWGMNMLMTGKAGGTGWLATLIVALLGSWLGDLILGDWLWMLAGFNVIAGAIGAVVLTWLWNMIAKQLKG